MSSAPQPTPAHTQPTPAHTRPTPAHTRPTPARRLSLLATTILMVAGCTTQVGDEEGSADRSNCTAVPTAVSSEKVALLTDLARDFAEGWDGEGCVDIQVASKSSGGAATLLAGDWDESVEGPRPVIWSPAASSWGALLNHRLSQAGQKPLAPTDAPSFMLTPLVIAMPKPMADALGYPTKPIGWSDILRLAQDPQGWKTLGHPEWGSFKLGKTNPNYSTSGLSALVAQNYAATGQTVELTQEQLKNPKVAEFNKGIEQAVVHYGDITMTFLNNWYRADKRGTSLTYASAVAVEEKSVIDYNAGNPDGVVSAGEKPRKPKVPLVAVYPREGTLYSDNPLYVLDGDWVTPDQKRIAQSFSEFVQKPANQKLVLEYGFRPGNPAVDLAAPIVAANGVNPSEPQTTLDVPAPEVLAALLTRWADDRREARVQLVLDVSGSMGEEVAGADGATRLELAKDAAVNALAQFKSTDLVGLRTFTLDDAGQPLLTDLAPIAEVGPQKETLANKIRSLTPQSGTPLFQAAQTSFEDMVASYDPARINAVVLLTDGQQDDGDDSDDDEQRQALLTALKANSEGEINRPVRVFTIGYSTGADQTALRSIAEASNGAAYNASDAATIQKVLTAVVSNF